MHSHTFLKLFTNPERAVHTIIANGRDFEARRVNFLCLWDSVAIALDRGRPVELRALRTWADRLPHSLPGVLLLLIGLVGV